MRRLLLIFSVLIGLFAASEQAWSADTAQAHRVAIQVSANDPTLMNLALNNATNIIDYYNEHHQNVQVEVVAYGPGLNMLREDTSPVRERIKQLSEDSLPSVVFSACGHTRAAMEKKEGKPIPIVKQARVVPSGVVRLIELQEQGWSYIRP